MHIIKKHISKNYSKGVSIKPKYIVIHNTDNESKGANAEAHYNYWNTNDNANSSIHFVVDDREVIQLLELNERAWHVGDNRGYSNITNSNTIGIEICVNSDGNFNKAYENAIELVKYLIKVTGISSSKVVRHKDASGKYCPRRIMDLGLWEDFKAKIQGESSTVGQQASHASPNIRGKKGYIFNVQTCVNVREVPGGKVVGTLKNKTDLILDRWDGDWIYIQKPIKGCIYRKYVHILTNTSTTHSTSSTKVLGKCTPTTELNVRAGAGTNFDKIGMVYPNGELILQEKKDNWYKISYTTYGGTTKTGWVSGKYVRKI